MLIQQNDQTFRQKLLSSCFTIPDYKQTLDTLQQFAIENSFDPSFFQLISLEQYDGKMGIIDEVIKLIFEVGISQEISQRSGVDIVTVE